MKYSYKVETTKEIKTISAKDEETALAKFEEIQYKTDARLEWIGAENHTVYGYARISTRKQNIERQIANIRAEYPDAVILQEAYTGTTTNRPEWNKLFKRAEKGDTIVFDEVSRMSRNASEGWEVYQDLFNRGVNLVFLKNHHIDTSVYRDTLNAQHVAMTGTDVDVILEGVNKYLMILAKKQIEITFQEAQAEVDNLRQRTKEGLRTAKLNGKQVGRAKGDGFETKKSKATKEMILKHARAFGGSLTDGEVIKLAGVDRHTYYKYKAQLTQPVEG